MKPVLSWTKEEINESNRILTNELLGVGKIISTYDRDGKFYRMQVRPLTEDEAYMVEHPEAVGN